MLFACAICHTHVENLLQGPAYFKRYFSFLKGEKKIPLKDKMFDEMSFPFHIATLDFALLICNKIEPFLTFFFFKQNGHWQYFCMKVKRITNLDDGKTIRSAVFPANSSTCKMSKIDLKKEENLISSDNLHLRVGTTRAINKCTTTKAIEVRKFRQNAQKMLVHFVEKFQTKIPLKLQIHTLYIVSFTKPGT